MADNQHQDAELVRGEAGILRCQKCGRHEPLDDPMPFIRNGWPFCHRYTMEWVTNHQLDAQTDGGGDAQV